MLDVGDWQIRSVVNGHIRLDGGAMFGVVPKELWQKKAADVDEQNRILLATRTLVAVNRRASRIMLVDTGTGSKWSAESAERFGVASSPRQIDNALAELGATPAEVTDVVITHLHFDHAGGMTEYQDQQGCQWRLRFPNAVHWIHARHWDHANHPTPRDHASFIADDFVPLKKADLLRCISGDQPKCELPGISWEISNGHTPGQLLPRFDGQGAADLLFVGDMIPTAAHLPLAWIMAYDLEPLKTLAERQRTYARCQQNQIRIAFPHDPEVGIASVCFDKKGRPQLEEVFG